MSLKKLQIKLKKAVKENELKKIFDLEWKIFDLEWKIRKLKKRK